MSYAISYRETRRLAFGINSAEQLSQFLISGLIGWLEKNRKNL